MTQPAENAATRTAREEGLPYCPQCGDMAHVPGECAAENLALGRCTCPSPGFEGGLPSHMCVCDAFDYETEGPCRVPGHDSRVAPIPPAAPSPDREGIDQ